MSYMQHLIDPAMIETRCSVDSWLDRSEDNKKRIVMLEEDVELRTKVRVFLSFCNQISIAYRFGALHKNMAFDIWNPFIPDYWSKLEFYMNW